MKKAALAAVFALVCAVSASAGQIIVATSDYETGNTAILDTNTGEFLPNALGHNDQDIAVFTNGDYVYFLEKSNGALSKYNSEGLSSKKPVYQYSVGASSNPQDIIFISDDKAYVIRYGAGSILVVNPNAANESSFVKGEIDISMFDTVGTPEAIAGAVYNGYAYVVLQRLNGWDADKNGLVVTIDTATDTIVDTDTATEGIQGRELLIKNPQFFAKYGKRFFIGGHVWGAMTEGVEALYLEPMDGKPEQEMVLDEEAMGMDITGVKVFNEWYGIYYSSMWIQDSQSNWVQVGKAFWFSPNDGTLGAVLPVPDPEGGAVMVDTMVYVGSRNSEYPGIYKVDMYSGNMSGSAFLTTLPPLSMAYLGNTEPESVQEEVSIPALFDLEKPSPNPFNPSTSITFALDRPGDVKIDIFNVTGQHIETLVDKEFNAGSHTVVWNASRMPSGVYFVRAESGGAVRTVKATLAK